jgi:hypothetical protein
MNRNRLVVLLVIVCAVAVVGYLSLTGLVSGPGVFDNGDINSVVASSTAWLETEEGMIQFPDSAMVGDVVPIYIGNTDEIAYWYVPVKDSEDMILGTVITDDEIFEMPDSIIKFSEPRETSFLVTKDNAYTRMIQENPQYSAGQIVEPRLVIQSGLFWMSEVIQNGAVIEELLIETSSF